MAIKGVSLILIGCFLYQAGAESACDASTLANIGQCFSKLQSMSQGGGQTIWKVMCAEYSNAIKCVEDLTKGCPEESLRSMKPMMDKAKAESEMCPKEQCPHETLREMYELEMIEDNTDAVCDGSWIVIHRRRSAEVSFDQPWAAYRDGFGNLSTNFWWGLEKVHQLTSRRRYEVKLEITAENGTNYVGVYRDFRVAAESEDYELWIIDFDTTSSTVPDKMSWHDTNKFSTKDRDNDRDYRVSCSKRRGHNGGWWFNRCHRVFFNGEWGRLAGVRWLGITNYGTSAEIKMRPLIEE